MAADRFSGDPDDVGLYNEPAAAWQLSVIY
jgi:hypothetical protein